MDHQLYATIQRKQPPIPPFSHNKGFDTMAHRRIEDPPDVCPYATFQSNNGHHRAGERFVATFSANNQGSQRCNTLGRLKNLEMTEYQKQKLIEEANTVKIRVSTVIKRC